MVVRRVCCGRREGIATVGPNSQQVSQPFVGKREMDADM
jgi:hypothetical protein